MSRCASGESGVFARNASHVMPLAPPRPRPRPPPPGVPTTRRSAPKVSLSKKYAPCSPWNTDLSAALSASAESATGSMPIADMSPRASALYGNGDEMPAVPPFAIHSLPPGLNSLRFAWPPKSSWLSRMRMRADALRAR